MIHLYQTTLTQAPSAEAGPPSQAHPQALRCAARTFLVSCLGDFLGKDARDLALEYLPTGRPVLKDHPELSFSLSHSENQVAVVCSRHVNVGVDLQHKRPFDERLFSRICTPQEKEGVSQKNAESFYFFWTVKEAAMKCLGLGFQYPMNQLQTDRALHQVHLLQRKAPSMSLSYPWTFLEFASFPAPENFAGHVVWAPRPGDPDYKPNFSLRT